MRVKKPDVTKVLETYLGMFGQGDSQTEQEALDAQREARGWDEHDPEVFETWAEE